MNKDRETAKKYLQQALEGDLMAMNNMGYASLKALVWWKIMPQPLSGI